ncbi:MAG: hypothetical protein ACYTG2_10615 [Planctomycetota bacterium]|jgi:hypothetical protein
MKTLCACLLSLALLPSCANTTASDYFLNRGGDLVDILRVNVKAGAGAGAKVEWSRFLHGGILYEYKTWAAGLANRELGYWNETVFAWGVYLGYHDETINQGLDGRMSGSYGWVFGKEGGSVIQFPDPNNPLDMLNVRMIAMFGIGFDVDLRVGEGIDFLLGLFQFDPANDDLNYSEMRRLEDQG